jgi:hypothetical protein
VRVRKHHVIFGGAAIAVIVQLAFAGGFLVDAAQTNGPYDALSAHRVPVTGRILGCAYAGGYTRGFPSGHVCRLAYDYKDHTFTMLLAYGANRTAYVDPENPSIRMSKVDFDGGPSEIVFDLVIASSLLAGAILVAVLHETHRVRRRKRAR